MTFLFCVQEDQKNSLCTCTLVNLSFRIFSKKIGNRFLQFIRHFLKRILVESLFAVFSVVVVVVVVAVVILCTGSLVNMNFRSFQCCCCYTFSLHIQVWPRSENSFVYLFAYQNLKTHTENRQLMIFSAHVGTTVLYS